MPSCASDQEHLCGSLPSRDTVGPKETLNLSVLTEKLPREDAWGEGAEHVECESLCTEQAGGGFVCWDLQLPGCYRDTAVNRASLSAQPRPRRAP